MEEQFNFGNLKRTSSTPKNFKATSSQKKGRLSLTLEELEDDLNYNHKLEQEYRKVQVDFFSS